MLRVKMLLVVLCVALAVPVGGADRDDARSKGESPGSFRIVDVLDLGRRDVRNFVFCQSTRQLYVSHTDKKDDRLYQWDVDQRELVHTYRLGTGYMCDNVTPSPDGRYLVVGCWPEDGFKCKILVIDTKEKRIAHDLQREDRIFETRFNEKGDQFWMMTSETNFQGSRGVVYNVDGREVEEFNPDEFKRRDPPVVWSVASSKAPVTTPGLYYRDKSETEHLLTSNAWHHNFGITKDGRFIAAATWDGELIVWRTQDAKEVFREKLASAYGYLAYDPKENRFLLGDATHDGTTKLRALLLPQP